MLQLHIGVPGHVAMQKHGGNTPQLQVTIVKTAKISHTAQYVTLLFLIISGLEF